MMVNMVALSQRDYAPPVQLIRLVGYLLGLSALDTLLILWDGVMMFLWGLIHSAHLTPLMKP